MLAAQPEALQHECLLAGGDDYELLFTAAPADHADVLAAGVAAGVAVHCCGRIEAAPGLRVVDRAGRAVATPWLCNYLKAEPRLQSAAHVKPRCTMAFDCLAQCGLRDGRAGWGQFCIDTQLAAALRGDLKKGLFFRGVGALPFGAQIRSVRDLMQRLLTQPLPQAA